MERAFQHGRPRLGGVIIDEAVLDAPDHVSLFSLLWLLHREKASESTAKPYKL